MSCRRDRDAAAEDFRERSVLPMKLARYLPILDWGRRYDARALSNDALAALIVTAPVIDGKALARLIVWMPVPAMLKLMTSLRQKRQQKKRRNLKNSRLKYWEQMRTKEKMELSEHF